MPFDLADKPAADLPPRPRDLVQSAQQRAKHAVVLVRRLRTRRSDPRPSATPAADAETPEFDASSPDRPDHQCRASVTASRSPNPQGPRLKFSSRVASTDRIRPPSTGPIAGGSYGMAIVRRAGQTGACLDDQKGLSFTVGLPGQRLTLPPAGAGRRRVRGCWETFGSQHPDPKRSGCRHVAAEERDQPDDRRGGVGDVPGRAETAVARTYCSPIRACEGQ
jgi:hypothetical protein